MSRRKVRILSLLLVSLLMIYTLAPMASAASLSWSRGSRGSNGVNIVVRNSNIFLFNKTATVTFKNTSSGIEFIEVYVESVPSGIKVNPGAGAAALCVKKPVTLASGCSCSVNIVVSPRTVDMVKFRIKCSSGASFTVSASGSAYVTMGKCL